MKESLDELGAAMAAGEHGDLLHATQPLRRRDVTAVTGGAIAEFGLDFGFRQACNFTRVIPLGADSSDVQPTRRKVGNAATKLSFSGSPADAQERNQPRSLLEVGKG